MNYDNLVNLLVDEIYKRLNTTENIEIKEKSKVVFVYEENIEKFNYLEDTFELLRFDNSIKDCNIVVVSRLCMRGLVNLSLGSSVNEEERFILKMLMKGKKVYVLEDGIEYKKYKETAPKALYNKYISYEDEISKFGVEVVKDLSSIKSLKNQLNIENQEDSKSCEPIKETKAIDTLGENSLDLRSKKLISENELKKPAINGINKVIVGKKSIVTPLAADFIRIHNMKIERI